MSARVVLPWAIATCLLALSPLLYFLAGASDTATEAGRIGFAAVPALLALALLVLATGARRAVLLLLYAVGVLILARRLGTTDGFRGDTPWALFWAASTAGWTVLSAALIRRAHGQRSP